MAVLFSDICGFTKMSGKMAPRQVIELLNDYFDVLCPKIKDARGDIDKFIGDAIMAFFVDDEPAVAAKSAVQAAIDMHQALKLYNQQRRKVGRDSSGVVGSSTEC